ncbi:hypothetical protein F441_17249 [Phytophthora nicotianae CJ01A1]|uniref:PH domain-containing protein n=1 Tax=Phytophthora nicotianae CJ01A1 TaxID=1317063 RepID=W2W7B2_PHYNI|nr:hypothetical protein F441_17249 [Phytophthora nicotianae CJ01A1]
MSPSVTPDVKTVETELEMKIKQSSAASPQLTGWVYWQRDPARSPDCWTKAFAVLDNAFLWLFQREESAPQKLLVQLAVADVDDAEGERLLCVIDPNGEELRICLSDRATFETWSVRLKDAAYHTAAFFRSSGLDVRDLPRWSNYRGTLEDYNRVSKRTRCKDAVVQMMRRWRIYQLRKH